MYRTRVLTEQDGSFTGIVYVMIDGIIDILEESYGHAYRIDAHAAAAGLREKLTNGVAPRII